MSMHHLGQSSLKIGEKREKNGVKFKNAGRENLTGSGTRNMSMSVRFVLSLIKFYSWSGIQRNTGSGLTTGRKTGGKDDQRVRPRSGKSGLLSRSRRRGSAKMTSEDLPRGKDKKKLKKAGRADCIGLRSGPLTKRRKLSNQRVKRTQPQVPPYHKVRGIVKKRVNMSVVAVE